MTSQRPLPFRDRKQRVGGKRDNERSVYCRLVFRKRLTTDRGAVWSLPFAPEVMYNRAKLIYRDVATIESRRSATQYNKCHR